MCHTLQSVLHVFLLQLAEPPTITAHPQKFSNVVQGELARFAIQATGTNPLRYHWQWNPAEKSGSGEWQLCPTEWCDGATLTIPSVQKSNEGSYRCIAYNCVGEQTSIPAKLSVGKNPALTLICS